MGEDRPDQQGVKGLQAALQRVAQRGDLLAQLAQREIGQDLGVGGP